MATMESLTGSEAYAFGFVPPVISAFARGGWRRGRVLSATDVRAPMDGGPDVIVDDLGAVASAEEAAIRRLNRAMMRAWRDGDVDANGGYVPEPDAPWRRAACDLEGDLRTPRARVTPPGDAARARERRCVHRIMDMLDEDLPACVPALSMMQRLAPNPDALEAFVDDMERRFRARALPTVDVLGRRLVHRWRLFLLVAIVASVCAGVGVVRASRAAYARVFAPR